MTFRWPWSTKEDPERTARAALETKQVRGEALSLATQLRAVARQLDKSVGAITNGRHGHE